MPWFVVRRMRTVSVTETASFEIEAEDLAAATLQAEADPDEDDWREIDREVESRSQTVEAFEPKEQ